MPAPSLLTLPTEILSQIFDLYFSDQRIFIFTPAALTRLDTYSSIGTNDSVALPTTIHLDGSCTIVPSLALTSKHIYQLIKPWIHNLPVTLVGIRATNDPLLSVLPLQILERVTEIVLFDTAISLSTTVPPHSILTKCPKLREIVLAPVLIPSFQRVYFVRGAMCILRSQDTPPLWLLKEPDLPFSEIRGDDDFPLNLFADMDPVGPRWRDRTFRALIETWIERGILAGCEYCRRRRAIESHDDNADDVGDDADGDVGAGANGLDVDAWFRDPRDGDGMDYTDMLDIEDFITAALSNHPGGGVTLKAPMRVTIEIRDLSAEQAIFAKEECDVGITWDDNGIRMEGFPDLSSKEWWKEVVHSMHDDGEDRSWQKEVEGMDVVHARRRWMVLAGDLVMGWEGSFKEILCQ
jgi:hypothetical protein